MAYTIEDIRTVWELVGDDEETPTWSEERVEAYLAKAEGCVYGAAALICRAWATKLAREWTSVTAGAISRSKSNPAAALEEQAKRYAAMSQTVSFDEKAKPAFGRARVDWNGQTSDADETRRIYQENIED
jgi:hypothetical protein